MKCSEIVRRIESLDPTATPQHVVRAAALICAQSDSINLNDDDYFRKTWEEVNLRLQAATDQHAAVTEELVELSESDPALFTQDQIWILIRAIKIQSQVLRMYVGDAELETI